MVISVVLCAPLVAGLVLPSGRTPTVRARSLSPIACEATVEDAWTTTPSGLKYMDIEVGGGAVPEKGAAVKVHYTGTLDATGVQFDSSKGSSPFAFKLGEGRVIPGWDEGISTMRVGGKRQLLVPSELGYGENGAGSIPPNSALRFECELISIESGLSAVIATFPGGLPNVILVSVLALSFVPYFLPEGVRPDAWNLGPPPDTFPGA